MLVMRTTGCMSSHPRHQGHHLDSSCVPTHLETSGWSRCLAANHEYEYSGCVHHGQQVYEYRSCAPPALPVHVCTVSIMIPEMPSSRYLVHEMSSSRCLILGSWLDPWIRPLILRSPGSTILHIYDVQRGTGNLCQATSVMCGVCAVPGRA